MLDGFGVFQTFELLRESSAVGRGNHGIVSRLRHEGVDLFQEIHIAPARGQSFELQQRAEVRRVRFDNATIRTDDVFVLAQPLVLEQTRELV